MSWEFLFDLFAGSDYSGGQFGSQAKEELHQENLRRARKRARTRLNRTWGREWLNQVADAEHITLEARTRRHEITGTSAGFPFQVTGRLRGISSKLRLQAHFRMEYPSLDMGLEVRPHPIPTAERSFQVLHSADPELIDVYLCPTRIALLREASAQKVNLVFNDTHVSYLLNRWTPNPEDLEIEINALTRLVKIITADPNALDERLETDFEAFIHSSTTSEGEDDSDVAWLDDDIDGDDEDEEGVATKDELDDVQDVRPTAKDAPTKVTQATPDSSPPLAFDELSAQLFAREATSFAIKERFEANFSGREVTLTGELKSVQSFSWDRQLDGAGVKATLQMTPIQNGGMERPVTCVVALPQDRAQALQALVGQTVTGRGTLVAIDALKRKPW